MVSLQIRQRAPNFSLPDQDGKTHTLTDYAGQWVLLYFYPEDDTSGCTAEACSMRDNLPKFKNLGAVVLGVSVDSIESHKKFAEKYGLPFTLLSDQGKQVVEQYGVWEEKSSMGKTYMGTTRSSFLIDPQGVIVKIYEKVIPEEHVEQVLSDLPKLREINL